MRNKIIYNNELNSLSDREFKLNLNSLDKDKILFDSTVFKSKEIEKYIRDLKDKLQSDNFFIIKNFGTSTSNFVILNFLLSKKLYFSKRMSVYLHNFKTKIKTLELSEELASGGFHTDFSFQDVVPDFISLQCLEADPKYPYLGRNYIVNTIDIFNMLLKKSNLTKKNLLQLSLPYTFGDKTIWLKPFYMINNRIEMKIHIKYVDTSKLGKEHYIENISLVELINQISLNLATDIVLNKGDILILSNRFLLHKRGECSLDLINNKSRELNSMRFFI